MFKALKAGRRRSSPAFGSLKNQAEALLRKLQQRVSEGVGPQTIVKLYNILTKWNILSTHGEESILALKQTLKQLGRSLDACEKQTELTTIHSCLEEAVKNCRQEGMLGSLAESEEDGDAGEDSNGEELSHPKSAPALTGGNKEYIRVYINSDTTFRSFVVASEETVREFLQRIAPKLSLSDDYNEGKLLVEHVILVSRRPVNEFAHYNDLICCYVALNISESIQFGLSPVRGAYPNLLF